MKFLVLISIGLLYFLMVVLEANPLSPFWWLYIWFYHQKWPLIHLPLTCTTTQALFRWFGVREQRGSLRVSWIYTTGKLALTEHADFRRINIMVPNPMTTPPSLTPVIRGHPSFQIVPISPLPRTIAGRLVWKGGTRGSKTGEGEEGEGQKGTKRLENPRPCMEGFHLWGSGQIQAPTKLAGVPIGIATRSVPSTGLKKHWKGFEKNWDEPCRKMPEDKWIYKWS